MVMSSTQSKASFAAIDTVRYIWQHLGLPPEALSSLHLSGEGLRLPSSFKGGHLAQASIALSGLSAAFFHSLRNKTTVPKVTVSLQHACAEFCSERLYTLNGKPPDDRGSAVGGLWKTKDGYVRIHDAFPHHRDAALKILEVDPDVSRQEIDEALQEWTSADLENAAVKRGAVVVALRSYEEWDALPQATAVQDFPILIRKIADGPATFGGAHKEGADKCLRGIRMVELSRVIAAPVAGKTLAAHGADVLWITSPKLPSLPSLDNDVGRGKRTAQLDLGHEADMARLRELLGDADICLQGYRPESLAAKGLKPDELAKRSKKGIIWANLSAWGNEGPWSKNRGFDSIVQTASGMNVSEAKIFGKGDAAKPMPCQALDHASGYFLATGIIAALTRRATEGGSFEVNVSLAGTMKYLRSLGQYERATIFECNNMFNQNDVPEEFLESRSTTFGELKAVRHSCSVKNLEVGWDIMPKPLGADDAVWL